MTPVFFFSAAFLCLKKAYCSNKRPNTIKIYPQNTNQTQRPTARGTDQVTSDNITWGFVYAVVVSNSSFLSFEGFVNGTDGVEDVDPVEQSLRQAIEEEKAK